MSGRKWVCGFRIEIFRSGIMLGAVQWFTRKKDRQKAPPKYARNALTRTYNRRKILCVNRVI